jgi:hypothetical protein
VIVAVAILFPMLVSPGQRQQSPPATASQGSIPKPPAATSSPVSPVSAPGTVLLVVEHEGEAEAIALVTAGPQGGVVLGLPAISLLRSGDRFDRLARIYSPEHPDVLGAAVAEAFMVPVAAVAAVSWVDLRKNLEDAGFGQLPSEQLDQAPSSVARLAQAVAEACSAAAGAGPDVWAELPLVGDGDGFREALRGSFAQTAAAAWTGQAVSGTVVENGGVTYVEPDVDGARGVLAGTGAGG